VRPINPFLETECALSNGQGNTALKSTSCPCPSCAFENAIKLGLYINNCEAEKWEGIKTTVVKYFSSLWAIALTACKTSMIVLCFSGVFFLPDICANLAPNNSSDQPGVESDDEITASQIREQTVSVPPVFLPSVYAQVQTNKPPTNIVPRPLPNLPAPTNRIPQIPQPPVLLRADIIQ